MVSPTPEVVADLEDHHPQQFHLVLVVLVF
jgi:hypothetical protein